MAENTVDIILRLLQVRQFVQGADEASKAVGGIGTAAETTGKKSQSGLKSLLKWGGATVAIAGATRFMHGAVDAASDLSEEINKTQVVFGSSGQALTKWSENAATKLAMTQQQALAAAATFGNMLVPMGFARTKAADMSKALVTLATDMSSFNNASPQDTLEAIRSGLAGETEPLRRFGVFLTADRVAAQAMSMGLVKNVKNLAQVKKAQFDAGKATRDAAEALKKHGKNSDEYRAATIKVLTTQDRLTKAVGGTTPKLTAAQKATATYALIMKDTKDAQGDFARTSGGLANKTRIMAAQFAQLKANLGRQLLPVVQSGVGLLSDFLKLLTPLTKNATALKIVIGLLATAFVAYKVAVIASTVATIAASVAQWELNAAMFANPIGLVVLAVLALAAGFVVLYTKVKWFHDFIDHNWKNLLLILVTPIGAAVLMIIRHWDTIKAGLQNVWNWIKSFWPGIQNVLTLPFRLAADAIRGAFNGIKSFVSGVATSAQQAFQQLVDFIVSIPDKIINMIKRLPGGSFALKALGAAAGVVKGAVSGAKGLAHKAFGWAGAQHGGTISRAGTTLVGEVGPELVVLPQAAQVIPFPQSVGFGTGTMTVRVPVYLDRRQIAEAVGSFASDKVARR